MFSLLSCDDCDVTTRGLLDSMSFLTGGAEQMTEGRGRGRAMGGGGGADSSLILGTGLDLNEEVWLGVGRGWRVM